VRHTGHSKTGDYNIFMEKKIKIIRLGTGFFVHKRIAPTIKRAEFVSERVSYTVMRGHRCNIIVVNVHAPSEEKSDESKEELEHVFYHFPKYHMKILLGDFNVKVGRENIFNRKLGMRVYIRIIMIMVLD